MKKTFSIFALSLTAILPHAHAAVVSLDVIQPVVVGSPFDVRVEVTDVFGGRTPDDTLVAYGFNVTVGNPAVYSYTGEDAGPLFDDISSLLGGTPMVAGFAINPAGLGPTDFTEPLVLAILHFKALSPGTTPIGVTYDPTDQNQGLIYADLPYGAINASTASAVPEPATLLMAGLILLAMFVARRQLLGRGLHL